MTWRQDLKTVSFRGVVFNYDSVEHDHARRVAVHQFPGRDDIDAEDLGGGAKEFTLRGFVVGVNYVDDADALEIELSKPGPGFLVHPFKGRMRVQVRSFRRSENTSQGGKASFEIRFFRLDEQQKAEAKTNHAATVKKIKTKSIANAINDFAKKFNVLLQPLEFIQSIQDEVNNVLQAVTDITKDTTDAINGALRTPFNMAVAIVTTVENVSSSVSSVADAFNVYKNLFDAGDDEAVVPLTTETRKQQARNQEAIHQLIQRTALVNAALLAIELNYQATEKNKADDAVAFDDAFGVPVVTDVVSRTDALAMRDVLLDKVDELQNHQSRVDGGAVDDDVFFSFSDLRLAIARDVADKSALLPVLISVTRPTSVPALVLSQELYGSPLHADDIVVRNGVLHPGFINSTVQVLSNV